MGIELIQNDGPFRLGIGSHGLGDMGHEIGFGASRADGRGYNLPGSDVQVGNQGLCSMPNILKFPPFYLSRSKRFGRGSPFQRLNPGHFVGAQPMLALRRSVHGTRIDFTDAVRLLLEHDRVFLGRVEPIPAQMRLNIRLVLKSALLVVWKYASQSPVSPLPGPLLLEPND